ncbi:hypothetical protein [Sphaerochaeta sp. PS]|uniref:hypothetical protein n=1 Tax=Sphaerochaeta sp. PS TaxID=3076336 RepID=UPI0028A4D825|nr:hypothetical protein [Sphaerochaeta sp. PS]MDT4762162.1 hypothetical protein [Sphaerochaeta sp. PS]
MQKIEKLLSAKLSGKDKPNISIFMQILIYLNLYIYIYDGFWDIPNRKVLGVSLALILLFVTIWKLRNDIVWIDLIIFSLFLGILFYARFVSQCGRTSLLNNLPLPMIGFCLGVSVKYLRWPKWSFYCYSIFALLPFLYTFFVVKADMEFFDQYIQMNRNSIPLLLILTYSLLAIVEVMNNRKMMPLIPLAIIVVCSFYSKSRAGLLLSIALLILIVVYDGWQFIGKWNFKELTDKMRIILMLCVAGIGCLLVAIIIYLFANSRFATQGLDGSLRVEIVKELVQEVTWKKALIGFIPDLFSLHSRIDASFIMAFLYLGIMSIFFIIAIIVALVIFWNHSFILFSILLIHTVYGFVEYLSPIEIGDIVLIPLLLIAFSLHKPQAWLSTHKPISLVRLVCIHNK